MWRAFRQLELCAVFAVAALSRRRRVSAAGGFARANRHRGTGAWRNPLLERRWARPAARPPRRRAGARRGGAHSPADRDRRPRRAHARRRRGKPPGGRGRSRAGGSPDHSPAPNTRRDSRVVGTVGGCRRPWSRRESRSLRTSDQRPSRPSSRCAGAGSRSTADTMRRLLDLRTAVRREISDAAQARLLGLGREGIGQLSRELTQVRVNLELYTAERRHSIDEVPQLARDVFTIGSALNHLLLTILVIAAALWARGRWRGWLEKLRSSRVPFGFRACAGNGGCSGCSVPSRWWRRGVCS